MTGYTVHTGSTEKFSEGWDRIFSGSKKKSRKQLSATKQRKSHSEKSRRKG